MKAIKNFISTHRHLFILLYYFPVLFGYQFLNKTVTAKYFMFHPIDNYIPFIPVMVIPYIFWYFFIAIGLTYLGFTCKKDFYRLALFMFSGMTICYIIYYFFPNGQNLRPVITDNNIFTKLVSLIYAADNPTNSAPSMHTIDSLAVYIAIRKNEKLSKIKPVQIATTIATILIIMSTVTLKQHSILDVIYGMLLSLILYVIIYRVPLPKFNFSTSRNKEIEER